MPTETNVHGDALCFMVMTFSTSKVGGWQLVAVGGWRLAVGGWWTLGGFLRTALCHCAWGAISRDCHQQLFPSGGPGRGKVGEFPSHQGILGNERLTPLGRQGEVGPPPLSLPIATGAIRTSS